MKIGWKQSGNIRDGGMKSGWMQSDGMKMEG
jgi:hypothetical protein